MKYQKFAGDLGRIQSLQEEKNYSLLVKYVGSILRKRSLYLSHPLDTEAHTECGSSLRIKHSNVLFFYDQFGVLAWLAIQLDHFIDAVYVGGEVYSMLRSKLGHPSILAVAKILSTISGDSCDRMDSRMTLGGLILSHARPAHYIYDQMVNIPLLSDHISAAGLAVYEADDCFFSLRNQYSFITRTVPASSYLIRPSILGFARDYAGAIEQVMISDSLNHSIFDGMDIRSHASSLVVWLGVAQEKRSLIGQVSIYASILKSLSQKFSAIHAVVDGMTSFDSFTDSVPNENKIFFELADAVKDYPIILHSLVGRDYRTKIATCMTCQFFITYAGTQSIVPFRICKKPGILHSNNNYRQNEVSSNVLNLARYAVASDASANDKSSDYTSYSIDEHYFFEAVGLILNMLAKVPSAGLAS
jgi:hypothetical protein